LVEKIKMTVHLGNEPGLYSAENLIFRTQEAGGRTGQKLSGAAWRQSAAPEMKPRGGTPAWA